MPLSQFDPLVAEWFSTRLGPPTEPQALAWPAIGEGRDVLLSAPTGSGKTLAAFLTAIDALVREARKGTPANRLRVIYVSPLKALSNDIQKNLERPLAEIRDLAAERGTPLGEIRTAVRTGDTPAHQRRKMLDEAPHILVTTPESLFLLLTSRRGRELLRDVETLILDEIHAVADDKRGSHLALSVERLEHLAGRRLQRIGLSATVKPMEDVARFLSPQGDVHRVQVGHTRPMELAVEVPQEPLGAVASANLSGDVHDRLAELVKEHRTTLVFVNTRRQAERVAHALTSRVGEGLVLPHHGSLSRELRLTAERRLKDRELRCVVATASLELGIDVGDVDLVCQLGSPRSISVALQRIGRSGHWVGATPHGRLFPTTRDELIECAAVVHAIRTKKLDRLEIPEAPRDVLAQQIVAEAACEDLDETELYERFRSVFPYRNLTRETFDEVVAMLSDGLTSARGRSGAYLHRDRVNGRIKARRGARLAALTSGGAIPDTAQYQVVAEPEGSMVGMVDEDFAVESMAGDVFLLGTTSWRIRRVEPGRLRVEDAHGMNPNVPFWIGEAPGRTWELSQEVAALRVEIDERGDDAAAWLIEECGLDGAGADQAVAYVRAAKRILGAVPSETTIVAERFFDESGGMQLVLHTPFGARVNRAWGLSLRKRFCRSFNLELQAAATDNGINIALTEQHAFPLDLVFELVQPATLEHVLTQALLDAPMFNIRWRWNVSRSLGVLRFSGGRKTPPPIQRMRAEDLLAGVFPDQAACAENLAGEIRVPSHPLVDQTIEDCLHEAMDVRRLHGILTALQAGEIKTVAVETPEPSAFSHEILNANPWAFLDDAPLEERRARAVQLRRGGYSDEVDGDAALSAEAIAQTTEEVWPLVRDAEELHDALLSLCVLPPAAEWAEWFASLEEAGRAGVLRVDDHELWVSAERLELVRQAYLGAECALTALPSTAALPEGRTGAVAEILRGWMDAAGPTTAAEIASRLALPEAQADAALLQLETEGQVMRGRFSPGLPEGETEWCNRRVLARIHRLTLRRLRQEIEPVSSGDFMRFLLRWQHAASGARLYGADGLLQVLEQLQGYEAPASTWESHLLPSRVADYSPELLDRLCLSGEISWGRLSPHPAFEGDGREKRRVRPTRSAPLSLFRREDAELFLSEPAGNPETLSHAATDVLRALETRGASFFADAAKASGRLPSEVEEALWELASAGHVTADGFDNLRALLDPKRRAGQGRGKSSRPRHAAGRWALLTRGEAPAQHAERYAELLLKRWGVVFRDVMRRESAAPPWRDLLRALRKMEARGEIRGGRFVHGAAGEQFALPEAVALLRAVRRSAPDGEEIRLSAADPLNLVGVIVPGERTAVSSNELVVLRDGVPVSVTDAHAVR